jgi:cyclopropane fatty-acyl-phospholipid synthase-like methyltransferase
VKRHAPATMRNREPIVAVLREVLPASVDVLEIASGTGEHAVFFAAALAGVRWQPSDADPQALASIAAHAAEAGLANLRAPLPLDVTADDWGAAAERCGAIVCINMIHIAPWAATEGLMRGAGKYLPPGGLLVTYGPYRFDGAFTAPSNKTFDAALRHEDPAWGVRDLADVTRAAEAEGLERTRIVAMPANNHLLVFERRAVG